MVINCLKDLFQPLISQLFVEKCRGRYQGKSLWWLLRITRPNMYCKNQYWEMRKWFLDCCRQYPTFQLPLFVLVTDTCLEIYNPGNLRTRFLFILKIAIFLIHLTDFNPEKNWSTGNLSATNTQTLEFKLAKTNS